MRKKNLISKRIFSIVLTIAVALSMMPTMAWAAGEEGSTSVENAVAQIGDQTFTSLPAALEAAQDGDTVKLLANHTTDWDAVNNDMSTLAVVTKRLTLDLNGCKVDNLEVGEQKLVKENDDETLDVTITSGDLTVMDSSADANGTIGDITFMSGKLDIQSGIIDGEINCVASEEYENIISETEYGGEISISGGTVYDLAVSEGTSVAVTGGKEHNGTWLIDGTLTISGGEFADVGFRNNGGTIAISGGTFGAITNEDGSKKIPLMPLLADDYAFYGKDTDGGYTVLQDGTAKELKDVRVKEHTHTMANGACACGYVCSHDNRKEDGTCSTCGASIIARVEVDNVTTYHADISDALKAAADNGKVTIIAEQNSLSLPEKLYADGTITLDLNGHRLEGNPLILGGYTTGSIAIRTGNLTIIDSSNGNGAISLKVQAGAKVKFYGGVETTCINLEDNSTPGHPADVKFYGGNIRGITQTYVKTYANLLPAGYCFYKYSGTGSDLGDAVKLAEAEISEGNYLAVAECTHAEAGADGKCLYCGIELGIRDNKDNIYKTLQEAITAALSNNSIEWLKVEKNNLTENVVFDAEGKSVTVDMNGKTLSAPQNGSPALTVSNGTLTIKGLATIEAPATTGTTEAAPAISVTGGELVFKGDLTAASGKNSQNSNEAESAIAVSGGKVTFEGKLTAQGGMFKDKNLSKQKPAVYAAGGELDFQEDLDLEGGLAITGNAQLTQGLSKGTFSAGKSAGKDVEAYRLSVEGSANYKYLGALLADDHAFADKSDHSQFKCVGTAHTTWGKDVTIIPHTHENWVPTEGDYYKCSECGEVCIHSGGFKEGACAVCGKLCPHAGFYDSPAAHGFNCIECGASIVAWSQISENVQHGYADLVSALDAAADGQTITLLSDIDNTSKYSILTGDDKNVTLDLNRHTINGGWIQVGINRNWDNYTSSTLKIVGSGSVNTVGNLSVGYNATLDLSEWTGGTIAKVSLAKNGNLTPNPESILIVGENTGTIGSLGFFNWPSSGVKTKLNGGTYGQISITVQYNSEQYGSLLAPGYAFQYIDTEKFVEYTKEATNQGNTISNVKVVKCPHEKVAGGTCAYCNASGIAATVDGTAYESFEAALTAIKDSNNEEFVLRLHQNAEYAETALNSNNLKYTKLTIDLNGYSLSGAEDNSSKLIQVIDGAELVIKDSSESKTGYVDNIQITAGDQTDGKLTLESGTINTLQVSPGSGITLKGGKLGYLTTGGDARYAFPVAYLLQKGYTLTDEDGKVVDLSQKSIGSASGNKTYEVKKISGADISTGSELSGNMAYGGSLPFKPSVNASAPASVTADWYIKDGPKHIAGAGLTKSDSSYAYASAGEIFDSGWMTGIEFDEKYEVFCVLTARDSEGKVLWNTPVTGYELTVNRADIKNAEITLDNTCTFTPNGQGKGIEQKQNITVKYNGKVLEKDKDYTVSGNTQANAGEYKLTVTGTGCYTGTKDADWTVSPNVIVGVGISSASKVVKKYDGTTAAVNPYIEIGTFSCKAKLGETTFVEPINVTADDYEIISVEYTSADVGSNKAFSYKVKIRNSNYKFENGDTKEFTNIEPNFACSIEKADAPEAPQGALTVVNNLKRTYTLDVSNLLPDAPKGEYGTVEYKFGEAKLKDGYTDGASVDENGMLTIPINKVDSDTIGSIGTVTVTVTTDNYADITLTVNVSAENKDVPKLDGEMTLTPDRLTYGDNLSSITISAKMKDSENETVAGSFTWKLPEYVPGAGTYEAEWIFTPDDEEKYLPAAGTAQITVNKVEAKGTPDYEKITASGKTLADAKLAAKDADGQEKFSVPGEVKWIDAEGNALAGTTEVKRGESYTWIFTPTDAANYETITGTIVLWAKASGGGGGSVTTPSSEVKTDDKTSQTGEKEKVTTSPTEVKNETKTDESGNQVTTAKVTVSEANKKEILKQAKENKSDEIIIKVSEKDVKDGAKLELNLEKSFIESILNDTDADLTIQTPDGEKTFTQEELKKLVESASGNTVTLDPTSAGTTDPADPTTPSTDKNAKLIKGIQNTTIVLKSKLLKSGKIRLTWTKGKGYKVDRFEIYRSVKKNSGYGTKAFFITKDGSWSKYLNTKNLKAGKTYYYKLRGVRIIGGKKYYTQWSNKSWKTVK